MPHISTTRSPQGVQGPLVKTYLAEQMQIDPKKIKNISIMPCIAKKDEAARAQLSTEGVRDNDVVISVREFSRLLRRMGVDLSALAPEPFDNPFMSASTGAAVIFGTTGGVMEATVRTVYAVLNHEELEGVETVPLRGLEGVRTAEVDLGPKAGKIKVAICHGLKNAKKLAEEVLRGESPYTFIEVMACPGGCIDGGGTSLIKGDYHPAKARKQQSLYNMDRNMPQRQSHNNPQIKALYANYLGEPNSAKAHHLLHTSYNDRSVKLSENIAENKNKLTLTD
ncbi:MAG: iron hydrogenase small subunit [Desulfovibrio sp.]|nr:iron hydrogenase small subunit [Desulfovibrio sp.]